jgi:hypothetical protein
MCEQLFAFTGHAGMTHRARPISLTGAEAFAVYGFFPRPNLEWKDVLVLPHATIDNLRRAGVGLDRLQVLQPSFAAWVTAQKATLENLGSLSGWTVDVPVELPEFCLADAISVAKFASPQRMCEMKLNAPALLQRYRMQYPEMVLFPYSFRQWVEMGLLWKEHVAKMSPTEFTAVFKTSMASAWQEYNAMQENADASSSGTATTAVATSTATATRGSGGRS